MSGVHNRGICNGAPCVIHNPLSGPWDRWKTHWREDRRIRERMWPHGVGPPVAEDYGRLTDVELIHGCCGCTCAPEWAWSDF